MTGQERETLRALIDARRRELAAAPPDGVKHGVSAYKKGCRCDTCRAATAAYKQKYRARRGRGVRKHGKNGYANGCRCDTCREGNNAHSRERWRARAA